MPLFSKVSRIYNSDEVNFMRRCYLQAEIILEENDQNYSASELSSLVIMLYSSGLRDVSHIADISARLAHQKFSRRHSSMIDSEFVPDISD